jgi:hypothetical protein
VATINLLTYCLKSKGCLECSTRANPEDALSSDYFEQKTAKRLSRNQSRENLTPSIPKKHGGAERLAHVSASAGWEPISRRF